jgi:hypothetical protein
VARRTLWFGLGAASGCVAAVWGLSSIRRASQRLTPEQLSTDLADNLRDRSRALGGDLRLAVAEGREAMASREQQLHDALRRDRSRSRTGTSAGGRRAVQYPGSR